MIDRTSLDEEPFSYQATKDGKVRIAYRGKVVTTLAERDAAKFLNRCEGRPPHEQQMAMAKATGHFKHGNERMSKSRK